MINFGSGFEISIGETASLIAEVMGVEIEITGDLGYVEMLGEGQHWLAPIFEGRIVAGAPVNAEPEKHEAMIWADFDAPPGPLALAARVALGRLR